MKDSLKWLAAILIAVVICAWLFVAPALYRREHSRPPTTGIGLPLGDDLAQCPDAPFIWPSSGWIGVLYGDSILGTANHSGLDIFALRPNGTVPVYAVYDGYLTRRPEWVSAVIIRHPSDPLQPGRQVWTYYTHMADAAGNSYILEQIPPGTDELPVEQGTLLGYQGDYSGYAGHTMDTHLHFSIVLDDGQGSFRNETDIANTLDPSPYLGMRLNTTCGDRPPRCRSDFACPQGAATAAPLLGWAGENWAGAAPQSW